MKNTAKSAIALIVTLFLGVIIGVLVYRAGVRGHFERLSQVKVRGGIERMMLRRINPTDEQRPKVEKILRKHGSILDSMRLRHHSETQDEMEAFMEELTPLLTEEQLERFTRMPPPREGPGRRGPRFMPGPTPEKLMEHIMLTLQPDSAVEDTVEAIVRDHFRQMRDRGRPKGSDPRALGLELRRKLEPFVPAERLDSLERVVRPPHLGMKPHGDQERRHPRR